MHILFSVRTVLWLTSNTRIDLKLVCQNKSDPFQLFKHNSGLQDYGTRPLLTIGPKCKNSPKNRWKTFVKLTDHSYACNRLTKFSYETHAWMTGNGNYVNLLNVAWKKNHCLQVNVFSAGFSHLQPLLDGFRFRVTLPNHGICWLLCVANTNNKPIKIPGGLRWRVPARRHRRAIVAPSPRHRRPFKCHATRQPLKRWRQWHGVENGTCKFSDTLGIAINLFDSSLLLLT